MPKEDQISIALDPMEVQTSWLQLEKIIEDRGSKYSVTVGRVTSNEEVKRFVKKVKSHSDYAKASHNSYAVRVVKDSQIFDAKSDDGEAGAGMVILRILQKRNLVNVCVVVTRWFGGIMLHADRFKHIQDATLTAVHDERIYRKD